MVTACKNCKFNLYPYQDFCSPEIKGNEYIDRYEGKIKTNHVCLNVHEINANLNCKYYKRKWWKFWIK